MRASLRKGQPEEIPWGIWGRDTGRALSRWRELKLEIGGMPQSPIKKYQQDLKP